MVDIKENAYKFAYIASKYPKHKLPDVLALFSLPPVDQNLAIWYAERTGLLKVTMEGENKGEITMLDSLKDMPFTIFGESTMLIKEKLIEALTFLAEKEADIEEISLSQWFAGYHSHDLLIALQLLLSENKIASYILKSIEQDESGEEVPSEYTFYTLYANRGNRWGKKLFKDQSKVLEVSGGQ